MTTNLVAYIILVCTQLSGELVAPTPLYSQPSNASEHFSQLDRQQAVTVEERYRAWYRVHIENQQTGWVRMLSVKLHSEINQQNSFGVIETINAFTGTKATKSTGVRGFDEMSFQRAKPNPLALAKMQLFAPKQQAVNEFVIEGNLTQPLGEQQ